MNRKLLLLLIVILFLASTVFGQGYYILGSSGIGKPVVFEEEIKAKFSFPIQTDWFFNEFRIPGFHFGYETWLLEAEDFRGDTRSLNMSFFDLGASWSFFKSGFLGLRGGWIFPLNVPSDRISNTSGPKGPYAGVFLLGDFDPYWLEIGFKSYFWKSGTSFGTFRTPEMWNFYPPKGIIYVTIHYRLFQFYD